MLSEISSSEKALGGKQAGGASLFERSGLLCGIPLRLLGLVNLTQNTTQRSCAHITAVWGFVIGQNIYV